MLCIWFCNGNAFLNEIVWTEDQSSYLKGYSRLCTMCNECIDIQLDLRFQLQLILICFVKGCFWLNCCFIYWKQPGTKSQMTDPIFFYFHRRAIIFLHQQFFTMHVPLGHRGVCVYVHMFSWVSVCVPEFHSVLTLAVYGCGRGHNCSCD